MNKSNEEDNQQLLKRIFNGDHSAEQELAERYWKGLFYIVRQRCKDAQLAADITQDAILVVISKARAGKINEPKALTAFVRSTGLNLVSGHFRKEQRRATDAVGETQFEVMDDRMDVSRVVESKQAVELVTRLIGEMPVERDKDILKSYFVEEQSKQDICKRLDLSLAHFDRVLYRARNRLKKLIEVEMEGENVLQ